LLRNPVVHQHRARRGPGIGIANHDAILNEVADVGFIPRGRLGEEYRRQQSVERHIEADSAGGAEGDCAAI
jgi:hypothetical protein